MPQLPSGELTFLFTDVEGSTRLWDASPDVMRVSLARHDLLLTTHIEGNGGRVVKERGEGDSFFAVFTDAADSVAAAADLQRAIETEPWPESTPIRVRVSLHTGEAELRANDYYGGVINRCARLRATAHGGQAVLRDKHDHQQASAVLRDGLKLFQDLGDRLGVAECLECLAGVSCLKGSYEDSAILLGAAYAIRAALGSPVPPSSRAEYESDKSATRKELGDGVFERLWDKGSSMTLEEVVVHTMAASGEAE